MIDDMATMPVQLPSAPATAPEARARYFNSGNAFNIKLPPVQSAIFTREPAEALAATSSALFDCDQSAALQCPFPATTPLMLARYAKVVAGAPLEANLGNTASIWYVIDGEARIVQGETAVALDRGDVFLLPGGMPFTITAARDSLFWLVGNDPQLAFDASAPRPDEAVSFVHYPAREIALQLDRVYGAGTNAATSGHALIFSAERTEASRNITPTMTLSLNTLKPHSFQPPHKHNSAAVTLAIAGDRAYSMVGETRCDWSAYATLVTPPAARHSHHNDGERCAEFLIVQDGGLHYHARTMGFEFL